MKHPDQEPSIEDKEFAAVIRFIVNKNLPSHAAEGFGGFFPFYLFFLNLFWFAANLSPTKKNFGTRKLAPRRRKKI
jgi:hypothetical protein